MLDNIQLFDNNLQSRYARAIYFTAKRQNNVDPVHEELLDLQRQFSADNRLVQFLRNPVTTQRDKASFVKKMIGMGISETAERIVSLLCMNNRLEMLPSIINIFSSAVLAFKQPGSVTVISPQVPSEFAILTGIE